MRYHASMQPRRTMLGAPGIATRSKDASNQLQRVQVTLDPSGSFVGAPHHRCQALEAPKRGTLHLRCKALDLRSGAAVVSRAADLGFNRHACGWLWVVEENRSLQKIK